MTATKTLQFGVSGDYLLEPAAAKHKALAEQWTAWDPDHAGRVDPSFWLEQDEACDSYLVSDGMGPVLFFKVIIWTDRDFFQYRKKVAEIHMQFMPASTTIDHQRIGGALLKGCPWLEELLRAAGVEEIYFDSTSPGLVAFTTKRMGFTQEDGRLRKRLGVRALA